MSAPRNIAIAVGLFVVAIALPLTLEGTPLLQPLGALIPAVIEVSLVDAPAFKAPA